MIKSTFLILILMVLNHMILAQDIEVIHHVSSDQTYRIDIKEGEKAVLYLHFYSPRVINYGASPQFFVSGWYELNNQKHHLVGIYRPLNSMVLYVSKDNKPKYLDRIDDTALNLDTSDYKERFVFPLNNNLTRENKGIWYKGVEKIFIENIDFDGRNVCHKIFLKGGDSYKYVNRSIDISDFVIKPFGNNDIFLEDYNIELYSSFTDDLGNLHLLLDIRNEYVIPSSLSSGGYFYFMLDKHQVIREYEYFETYNQGRYISYIDENFIHPTKQRFLVLADWSNSQIIGSFIIEKSQLTIEKKWIF